MIKFLNSNFLLGSWASDKSLLIVLTVVFGIMIVIAAAIRFLWAGKNPFVSKYAPLFLTVGILGLIHTFGWYEALPWLSSRFFLLFIILLGFVWLVWLAVVLIKNWPKYQQDYKKEIKYQKYLPKAKSR